MQGIGLDRIDFTRRPPSLQEQQGQSQRQPTQARNQHGAQRFDAELARKTFPDIDVEQERMKRGNRNAHRKHDPPADGSDQRRQDHQTRFMRANEGPQPERRLEIA